jgi:hypothetical protein
VYIYSKIAGVWSHQYRIFPPDAQASDRFGSGLAVQGACAYIGAMHDDDIATDAGAA